MRRVLGVVAVLVAAAAVAVVAMGAGGNDGGYKVRAIFDNAGFVIPGEDVKVAGVRVGRIDSLDITPEHKAVVVLDITDPGYQDFRRDAGCIVRPQGLIGERFVECSLTEKRSAGEQPPPALAKIAEGPGKGQYLLPVERTSKAVDLDLIGDVMRRPVRERLSLILNELGTGLAGRGSDLDDVIRRANPALKETDDLLRILASQNRVIAQLARNSDTVLAPLARERVKVADAIDESGKVAAATADRRAALEADISKLPRFLTELKPTMTRLGALSDEMTPVLTDLGDVAPEVNKLILQLGPFSQAAIPSLDSLGEAAKIGTPAVTAARPVIADLRRLAAVLRPVGGSAARLLKSFRDTQGIERAMDYIFYQVAAINGFDSFGHYLRAGLIVNQCASYAVEPTPGCSANFPNAGAASAASASAAPPAAAAERSDAPASPAPDPATAPENGVEPVSAPQSGSAQAPGAQAPGAPADGGSTTDSANALMDYLFGKDR
jgi:phospholipid/cholesterol/gamma-HCH transport system substrate-binding protein